MRRAWSSIDEADVVIYLVDASKGLQDADQRILDELTDQRERDTPPPRILVAYSKCDLIEWSPSGDNEALWLSVKTEQGMDQLIEQVTGQADYNHENHAFMARRRHVDALQKALDALRQAVAGFAQTRSGELIAEDLRQAQQSLNEITGEFSSDDLLGKIFSSFCIGK